MANVKELYIRLSTVDPKCNRVGNMIQGGFLVDISKPDDKGEFITAITKLAEEFWEQMQKGKLK